MGGVRGGNRGQKKGGPVLGGRVRGGGQVHLDLFWSSRLGAVKKKATLYCKLQGLTFVSAVNYNTKWS